MKEAMINAMIREIGLQYEYLQGEEVDTIYFGGGTPSALPPDDIGRVLEKIFSLHRLSSCPEITLESNPDDIVMENLHEWKKAGINRLSIGVQAFQDHILMKWNRSHDAKQALKSIRDAQDEGFDNITADLIYGDPDLSDAAWEQNIMTLLELKVPHLSSYALTVEEKTALAYQIHAGRRPPLDEEKANRQYAMLQEILASNGYDQYEVSNFSKPGFISRHNSSYWSGAYYLGIGPSAHSYNGISRQWNISHNIRYTQSIEEGRIPFEMEVLSPREVFNETVMTGIRTSAGIQIHRIQQLGYEFLAYFMSRIEPLRKGGKVMTTENGAYRLLPAYFFFADGLASDLFMPATFFSHQPPTRRDQ